MIKMDVKNDKLQHVLFTANQPVAIEVITVRGKLVACVYDKLDYEPLVDEPIGVYDFRETNEGWEISTSIEDPSEWAH